MKQRAIYRVVQPYGRDLAHESTVISEHASIAEAFEAIDRDAEQMAAIGAPTDAIRLLVIDHKGQRVERPRTH